MRSSPVVACGAVSLCGIDSVPSDLIRVLRSLPLVADRLDAIAASTSEVPRIRAGIDALGGDTRRIAGVQEALERLANEMGGLKDELGQVVESARASIDWRV